MFALQIALKVHRHFNVLFVLETSHVAALELLLFDMGRCDP